MDKKGREYLSDHEIMALEKFNDDKVMVEAVRKVLLEGIYFQGGLQHGKIADPSKNFMLALVTSNMDLSHNEVLGEKVRSAAFGVIAVESGFKAIEQYVKQVEKKEIKKNHAR